VICCNLEWLNKKSSEPQRSGTSALAWLCFDMLRHTDLHITPPQRRIQPRRGLLLGAWRGTGLCGCSFASNYDWIRGVWVRGDETVASRPGAVTPRLARTPAETPGGSARVGLMGLQRSAGALLRGTFELINKYTTDSGAMSRAPYFHGPFMSTAFYVVKNLVTSAPVAPSPAVTCGITFLPS
jgi:hypothetical protein